MTRPTLWKTRGEWETRETVRVTKLIKKPGKQRGWQCSYDWEQNIQYKKELSDADMFPLEASHDWQKT